MNLDALLAPTPPTSEGRQCLIGAQIENLPDTHRHHVKELLEIRYTEGGLTNREIYLRFRSAGLNGSETAIGRHRRGDCDCPTERNN